jgi:glycosyltransferase involved in cell wall biosynthesis
MPSSILPAARLDPVVPDEPAAALRGKVLLVAPQPFFVPRGTPINVLMLCRALTRAGVDVDLLTGAGGEDIAPLPGLSHERAAALPGTADLPVGFSVGKIVCNAALAAVAVRRLRAGRHDVVHAIEEAAFWAVPLGRALGRRTVMDLDSDLSGQLGTGAGALARSLAGPASAVRRRALRLADVALSVAPAVTALVRREAPATPVHEIPDVPMEEALRPTAPDAVAALRRRYGLETRRLAIYTGNFDRRQGVEVLVDAMTAVVRTIPDARLVLIGGEPATIERLRARARERGVGDTVVCLGRQPLETMPEFMAMADVLVSPRLEPLVTPLKLFAYMASARPIVATDLPTHTNVLDARAAFLVPPTAEGLAHGIVAALRDPADAKLRGRAARRLVDERYTFEAFADALLAAYRPLLEPSGGA